MNQLLLFLATVALTGILGGPRARHALNTEFRVIGAGLYIIAAGCATMIVIGWFAEHVLHLPQY